MEINIGTLALGRNARFLNQNKPKIESKTLRTNLLKSEDFLSRFRPVDPIYLFNLIISSNGMIKIAPREFKAIRKFSVFSAGAYRKHRAQCAFSYNPIFLVVLRITW